MATYFSDKVILNPATGVNTVEPKYMPYNDTAVIATFTLSSTVTLTAGDTIQLMDVPAGVRITEVQMDTGKLDPGTALVFNVGDALNPSRLFLGSTVGQAGGYAPQNQGGVLGYTFPAVTRILATITTSATGATGIPRAFVFVLFYSADG